MNLYELACEVSPDALGDQESKVIWKNSVAFVYLFRSDGEIFLRMSGSVFQMIFYTWDGQVWQRATMQQYNKVREIWADERK